MNCDKKIDTLTPLDESEFPIMEDGTFVPLPFIRQPAEPLPFNKKPAEPIEDGTFVPLPFIRQPAEPIEDGNYYVELTIKTLKEIGRQSAIQVGDEE